MAVLEFHFTSSGKVALVNIKDTISFFYMADKLLLNFKKSFMVTIRMLVLFRIDFVDNLAFYFQLLKVFA
jgi:hypothetical protein